ncbi:hypothetical protein QF046_000324 [Microbacterium sp. W4I4]|uniref:beta strand repeat-containing protein n=1 Tax=Microbacterium sp. W4I4 TaxID=3042295 RepID=UPI002782FD57|nr:hypothetical protein [Microbacterium sp. W4I4]MDQ0612683.1 hypothetical protein [Microbacterium sp. W4I4]
MRFHNAAFGALAYATAIAVALSVVLPVGAPSSPAFSIFAAGDSVQTPETRMGDAIGAVPVAVETGADEPEIRVEVYGVPDSGTAQPVVGQPASLGSRPLDATAPTDPPAPADATTTEPAPAPQEPVSADPATTDPAPAPAEEAAPEPVAPLVTADPAPADPTPVDAVVETTAPTGGDTFAPSDAPQPADGIGATEPAASAVPAPWLISMTGTAGTLVVNPDGTVTFQGVTRPLAEISEIRITGTDGDDTLTIDLGADDPGIAVVFDGAAGFDTLVTRGAQGLDSRAVDASSGTLVFGTSVVTYTNIEPITDTTPGSKTHTLTAGDNDAELLADPDDVTRLLLRSVGGDAFEQISFVAPSLAGETLTLEGGDGHDSLVVRGGIDLGFASFVAHFEWITFDGAQYTGGALTLDAQASNQDGVPLNLADCTDFDDFSIIGCLDHDATAQVIIEDSTIDAVGDVTLRAHADVVPDATAPTAYAVIVDSTATVAVRGASRITASGALSATAESVVGPFELIKQYGDAAIISSTAASTIGGTSLIDVDGAVNLAATSTVTAAATPQTDSSRSEGTTPGTFDAAVAVVIVNADAISRFTDTAHAVIGGALGISATNTATVTATGDAANAGSGAGIAIVYLAQNTEAAIDSTSPIATTAASLTILADQTSTVTARSKAGKGGATQNNKASNGADRGAGQASTDDGAIDVAGALSVVVLDNDTSAHITGGTVSTSGAQAVTARAKNIVISDGDAGTTDGSGSAGGSGLGLAIGIGIIVASILTEAFLSDVVLNAPGGVAVTASDPAAGDSSYTASGVSGQNGGGSASIAGSLAVVKKDARTSAQLRGTGDFGGSAVSASARGSHTSSAKATAKQAGGGSNGTAVGVGASVALSLISTTVESGVAVGAAPTGLSALTVTADGTDAASTETIGGAGGGSTASLTGVASIAIHNVRTVAGILTGPALFVAGPVIATATQTATAVTTATGATGAGAGATLAATIAFALTSADHEASATIDRGLTAQGAVTVTAENTSSTRTSAEASAEGAPGESGGTGKDTTGKDANAKSNAKLTNASGRTSGGAGGGSTTPAAQNEDGTSVSVAAALAFNLVRSATFAMLSAGQTLVTTGTATFIARSNTDATATAKGTATNSTSVGIGAALAVNRVRLINQAGIGIGASVQAAGLTITAAVRQVGTDAVHAFEATAEAGAGNTGGSLGIAGAFALNLVEEDTSAAVLGDPAPGPHPGPTPLPGVAIVGGGAVVITAGSKSTDKASAKATQSGGATVGLGAAIALNLPTHRVFAGISQVSDPTRGPPMTGAGALTLTATHDVTLTTQAEAGGKSGSVTIVPSVAIVVASIRTIASLGAGSTLTASSITASATQNVTATTTATGSTVAGSSAGIGVSLALAVLDDIVAEASSARSIDTTGAVSLTAHQRVEVETKATAATKGASPSEGSSGGGKDVNQKADANLAKANQSKQQNAGGGSSTSSTPKAASGENGGSSVSIAGAIAINVVASTVRALFAGGITIDAGGAVALEARGDTDSKAEAAGDSATDGSVGIGAGVAVQVVTIVVRAITGASTITAAGLTVTAGMLSGDDDDVVRRWNGSGWELVESGKQLPGPSKDDLAFVRTSAGDGGDDGLYKFDGSNWSLETDVSLTGTVATLPAGATDGEYYLLKTAKDGHPAGSVWKRDGGAWVFVTKLTVKEKSELPKDEIDKDSWFQLTQADGANVAGFYKRDDQHKWIHQASATVGSGDQLPPSPAVDTLFRLFEHEVTSIARAGASKATSVGVAGALAINILDSTVDALISTGAVVTLGSAAGSVTARSNERDAVQATSRAEVGSATGVGASFALQVIDGSDVRAEVQNGAALTGGAGLTVAANGLRDMSTKAEGGTEGGTAVTPVVALVVSVDDDVTARVGTSGTDYIGTGAISIRAVHTLWVKTEGKADAAGKSTAVGVDLAINAVVEWDTLAEITRDMQGTSVEVLALSEARTEARSVASAKGAEESDSSGDQKSNEQVNGAGNPNTQGTKDSTAGLPSSNGGTNGSNGAQGADGAQSGQSGTSGSQQSSTTAVAAAVAVNWLVATSIARIAANTVVTATTGAVVVRSELLLRAYAFGVGSAIDLDSGGTKVGATIGLNVQDADNVAAIGGGAQVTGQTGITVAAVLPDGARNDFIVWSFAAGGGKSTSVAGSAAVQILLLTTEASVGAGADLDAPAGGVAVTADQAIGLQNLAIAGALVHRLGIGDRRCVPGRLPRGRHASLDRFDRRHADRCRRDGRDRRHREEHACPARARGARPHQGQDRLAEAHERRDRRRGELGWRGGHGRVHRQHPELLHTRLDRRWRRDQPGRQRRRLRAGPDRARGGRPRDRRCRRHTGAEQGLRRGGDHGGRGDLQLRCPGVDRRRRLGPRGRFRSRRSRLVGGLVRARRGRSRERRLGRGDRLGSRHGRRPGRIVAADSRRDR